MNIPFRIAGSVRLAEHTHYAFSQCKAGNAILFLMIVVLVGKNEPVHSQDLFGEPAASQPAGGNELLNTGVSESNTGLDPNERSAVVRSLRLNPPKTPSDLARAIQFSARIRRWSEVSYWLDQLPKFGIDETTSTQMVQTAGTQTFLSLLIGDAELSDSHRGTIQKILDLANSSSHDPNKLRSNVVTLLKPDKQARVRAFVALQSAGNRGVKALMDYMLSEHASSPNPTMSEAFSLLGKQAVTAWQAAMMTSDARARGRLALLAAYSGEPSLALDLCTVANDRDIDESVHQTLASIVANRNKSIPSGPSTFRHAIDQLHQALKNYQQIRRHDEADAFTGWQLSEDGHEVIEQPARESDLAWARIVQLALCALRTGPAADIDSALAVAVQLESSARRLPEGSSFEQETVGLSKSMRDSYEFGCLVLDASESSDLASAQKMAVKNLSRWATPGTTPSVVRERLVRACKSGYAPVRYEAASTLVASLYANSKQDAKSFADQSFEGRNRLERILSEMRGLESRPLALVIGGSTELRTHTHELLEAYSFRVTEAASAAQTMASIREGLPIESICIVDRVLEMDLGQLIQRIRGNPTTAKCPIALLAASLSSGAHSVAAHDDRVVMGSVPPAQAGFGDILRRMSLVGQSPTIDSTQRIEWKDRADAYWNNIQELFALAHPTPNFKPVIETAEGQSRLISIVVDDNQSMPKREQASQIFVQSVKQFGLLISSETANAQYDVYNTRGPYESELCVVLGRVLDAIEASKGQKEWSAVSR
ncbi:MAG: hypothetical protein ABL921_06495 [Pirellula sp.]